MKQLAFIPFVIGGFVFVYFILRYKASWTMRMVEQRLADEDIDATVLSGMAIPPFRLWLRNRKGDGWAKVQMKDGTIRYARVRHKLFGGDPIDFFD